MSKTNAKFLQNCAKAFSADTHAKRLLRSYYVTISRNICCPDSEVVAQMCPHCSSFWGDSAFEMKLKSTPKKFHVPKQLEQLIELKKLGDLSKNQGKLLKWLQRKSTHFKIICKFCMEVTVIPIEQAYRKALTTQPLSTPPVEFITTVVSKKKRKKKKDKTAGLKVPVVSKDIDRLVVTKVRVEASKAKGSSTAKAISKTQQKNVRGNFIKVLQMHARKSADNPLHSLLK